MRISTEHIGRILETYFSKIQKVGTDKLPELSRTGKQDQATFSSRAEEIEKALQLIANLPEVRDDKVARLRKQIADGTFEVSAEKVAEKIISEAQLDKK